MTASPHRRRGILAGGNWIIDHVKIIDVWPTQDTLATILRQFSGNGGAPYNVLIDLARLGALFPLAGIGLLGDDVDGRAILNDCRSHGIDTSGLHTSAAAPTSYTDVMSVEGTGRRTFFHRRGANAHLGVEHFEFGSTEAKIFHLGYLLLLDRLDEIAAGLPLACDVLRRASAAGLRTSLDCVSEDSDRFHRIVAPALPYVDILFANDFEAEKLTRITLRRNGRMDRSAVEAAGARLLESGVRSWAVVHFPEGVFACAPTGQALWQASVQVPLTDIAGTAGAGDALAAGVLFGIHEDWPMSECLRLGVCVAAASLYDSTCSGGIKSLQASLALESQLGCQPAVNALRR